MIDTLNLCLYLDEASRKTAFSITPKCFDDEPTEIYYPDKKGEKHLVYCGKVGSLNITISHAAVKIKDSSFAKWLLGTNLKTLQRQDIEDGIKKLSDRLHLPMDKAQVQRLDIGCNLIMKNQIDTYTNRLSNLTFFQRLPQEHGLYYDSSGGNVQLAFYDKLRERKNANEDIPDLFKGANVLRYELRLLHRLPTILKVPEVKAKDLYDEESYIQLWRLWRGYYYEIGKINEVEINYKYMKGITRQNQVALIEFVLNHGGVNKYLQSLKEALKRGDLTKKEEFDMRKAVNRAFADNANNDGIVRPSDEIKELNEAIDDMTLGFR